MKKDKAHFIAFVGVMFALIFVLFLLESTVLSGFGVTACILSLPMAIALSVYDDWKKSFIGGTLLGLSSCLFCLVLPSFLFYANPLISVLPRTCLGITAYWTYFGLSKLFKKVKKVFVREVIPAAVAGVIGSLTNTVLYLLSINIWSGNLMGAMTQILQVAVGVYFPIELVACIILVPVYVKVLRKVGRKCFAGCSCFNNKTENEKSETVADNCGDSVNHS